MDLIVHRKGRMSYEAAYQDQMMIREQIRSKQVSPFHLYLCEHDPVLTKGRNFTQDSLLHSEVFYQSQGISVVSTDRGGDITFHGPGQITAYFLFDLSFLKKDVHWFIHQLEDIVIRVLGRWGVSSGRNAVNSGVWVGESKLCAIGVGFKHWISYHGIGLNVNTDMRFFDLIVPCGLKGKGVTSLKEVLRCSEDISLDVVNDQLIECTRDLFLQEFNRSTAE